MTEEPSSFDLHIMGRFHAAAEILKEAGTVSLEMSHTDPDKPPELEGQGPVAILWQAVATWSEPTRRLTSQWYGYPAQAAEELAVRKLSGGRCTTCGGVVVIGLSGVGHCGWTLHALDVANPDTYRYVPSCVGQSHQGESTRKLVAALREAEAPDDLVVRADRGYYHDYVSPLELPTFELVKDLLAAGLVDLADRVKDGEFDASRAEGQEWAASPEGRAVMEELARGGSPRNREARRREQREGRNQS